MNTASLELSKQLFELSGWDDTAFLFTSKQSGKEWIATFRSYISNPKSKVPAYDSGFLLRKLPSCAIGSNSDKTNWQAIYDSHVLETADTPEDALCRLAIQLFNQKILGGK